MKLSPATIIIAILLVLLAVTSFMLVNRADDAFTTNRLSSPSEPLSEQSITEKLKDKLNFTVLSIADSPVPGLLQLFTDKGLFYLSENGDYFLQARIYNIQGNVQDETETVLRDIRLDGIKKYKDSAIEFKAENEEFVINVFTDATCGYCRKLHNEMQQFHDEGITVRYLAWPRAGINSQVYRDTVSIWCSQEPNKAMTEAKAGKQLEQSNCENNVAEHYQFGLQIGVTGTPNIVLPDGSMVRGYQPAKMLAQTLRKAS